MYQYFLANMLIVSILSKSYLMIKIITFLCLILLTWLLFSLVVTETTGSVSGLSITSELNDELNDLIQRFHNQLHDSQVQ